MILSLSSLLTLTLLGLLVTVPQVSAATGLVCIANSSVNPSSCPSSPPSLSAPVGSSITLAVNIQGSDSLNGFDIAVQVDPSVLQPLNITVANSVVHDPRLIVAQSTDSSTGIARLAIVAEGYIIAGPVTGNLFNILYKVLSSTKGTAIVFQTGCSGTSVPSTCVTVVNGNTVDPEMVQTATFGGTATPDFTIAANPLSQTVQQGSSAKSAITVASLNGFSGTVNFSLPAMCLAIGCPSWSISPSSVFVASGGTAQATLTFTTSSNTPAMIFNVTVTGTSGSLSHSVTVSFKVVQAPTPDFSMSANPASQNVQQGSTATSMIVVTSINGFSGTFNLSSSAPPLCPSCPTWSLSPRNVTLPSGGSATSTLTFSTTTGSPTTTFVVNVTGTNGNLSHSTTSSFTIVAALTPGTVCIAPASSTSCPSTPLMAQGTVGGQLSVAVNVQNSPALNGFDILVLTNPSVLRPVSDSLNGTVLQNVFVVRNSVNSTSGLVRVAAVSQGSITTAPTTGRFFSITYNIVGTTQGTYILFPVGCSGTSNDNICVTVTNPNAPGGVDPENVLEANFTSTAPPPDFASRTSPSSLTIIRGQSASSTVTLTSLNGFTGTVTLSATITPSVKKGPGVTLTPTSLNLSPGGSDTAILTVSTNGGTQTGTYTITITATSGSLTHTTAVTVTILSRH